MSSDPACRLHREARRVRGADRRLADRLEQRQVLRLAASPATAPRSGWSGLPWLIQTLYGLLCVSSTTEVGDEDLLARQRRGQVVHVDRHAVGAGRVERREVVVDEDLELVAAGGHRGHGVDAVAARAAARHQALRAEVVQHLEGVEGRLAHALKRHETEHLAERQRSALAQDVRARGAARFVEDVRQHPVREHVERRRVALVLVGEQLDALEDEAARSSDCPCSMTTSPVLPPWPRVRRVPLGVERLHGRGRVAAAGDLR